MEEPVYMYNKKDKEMYLFFINDQHPEFDEGQTLQHYDGVDAHSAHQRLKEESFNLFKEINPRYKRFLSGEYKYAQVIKNVIYKYGECRITKINHDDKKGYEINRIYRLNQLNSINFDN